MGVRRSGFALMVVLIAVAAVFALALRGAVVARSTRLEVGAIHGRVVAERRARAAAVIVLKGLVPLGGSGGGVAGGVGTDGEGEASVDAGDGAPPAGEEGEGVELPEFLKELIPELAELEEDAKDELDRSEEEAAAAATRVTDGRGLTGRAPRGRALSGLSRVGLPSGAVRVEVGGRAFRVRAWDALGLLNVNEAEEAQLVRYFDAKGVGRGRATELAHQILDWRDENRVARERGAEEEEYGRRGITCRNGEFFALEELLFLPSMDRELYESIEGELAVGGEGKIHVGSAPRAVLASLPGMDDGVIDAVLALREEGGLTAEGLEGVIPPARRGAIIDMVRLELSGLLRLRVEALEGEGDRVVARFDGLAMVNERGVQEVGLRPM